VRSRPRSSAPINPPTRCTSGIVTMTPSSSASRGGKIPAGTVPRAENRRQSTNRQLSAVCAGLLGGRVQEMPNGYAVPRYRQVLILAGRRGTLDRLSLQGRSNDFVTSATRSKLDGVAAPVVQAAARSPDGRLLRGRLRRGRRGGDLAGAPD